VHSTYERNVEKHRAQYRYTTLGEYRTLAAARGALTRAHNAALRERNREHMAALAEIRRS